MLVADPESAEADLVKVVDFGLAKVFGGADDVRSAVPVTRPGIVLGSPRYMSPEQVQSREVDGRADIYALGVVMFEMLTGRVPFEGTHPSEIMTQHVRDLPPALADVAPDVSLPHQVEGLVHRCLEKNPDHRYLHAEDLIAELKRAIVLLGGDGSFDVSLSLRSASMPPARMSSTTQPALTMDPSFEGRLIVEASPGRWSSPWWGLALVLLALIASLAFWVYVLKI
ncbi:MAG: serine/threonine-protein kinase, partial [Myxococcota bacterium]